MHLITGRGTEPHVTAENDAIRNAQIYGNANHVIDFEHKFSYSMEGSTKVRIFDGYGIMNGRFFEIPKGTYEDLTIDAGTIGKKRVDLICARYTKNTSTGIETINLVVIKGTPSDNYEMPSYNEGSIFDGSTAVDYPLYRINLNGQSLEEVIQLFDVVEMGYADRVSLVENEVSKKSFMKVFIKEVEVNLEPNQHYLYEPFINFDYFTTTPIVYVMNTDIIGATVYLSDTRSRFMILLHNDYTKTYSGKVKIHITLLSMNEIGGV